MQSNKVTVPEDFKKVIQGYVRSANRADSYAKDIFKHTLTYVGDGIKIEDVKDMIREVTAKQPKHRQNKAIRIAVLANRFAIINKPFDIDKAYYYNIERVVNYLYALKETKRYTDEDFSKACLIISQAQGEKQVEYNDSLSTKLNEVKSKYRIVVDEDGVVRFSKVEDLIKKLNREDKAKLLVLLRKELEETSNVEAEEEEGVNDAA